ncbi:hypothetical protein MMC10_001646 [Thelotrema lepadinum]|nr:hypothetical protein [Thelotrema lepadinum]
MRLALPTLAFALVAGASAGEHHHSSAASNVTYTTEVVTAFTTFCPGATTLTHLGSTYTVTSATTLTITNCPCTITKPVHSSSHEIHPTSLTGAPIPIITSGAGPTGGHHHHTSASGSPTPYGNGTAHSTHHSKTSALPSASITAATSSSAPIATGAADRNLAGSGVGLAAVLGFAAYFL